VITLKNNTIVLPVSVVHHTELQNSLIAPHTSRPQPPPLPPLLSEPVGQFPQISIQKFIQCRELFSTWILQSSCPAWTTFWDNWNNKRPIVM